MLTPFSIQKAEEAARSYEIARLDWTSVAVIAANHTLDISSRTGAAMRLVDLSADIHNISLSDNARMIDWAVNALIDARLDIEAAYNTSVLLAKVPDTDPSQHSTWTFYEGLETLRETLERVYDLLMESETSIIQRDYMVRQPA